MNFFSKNPIFLFAVTLLLTSCETVEEKADRIHNKVLTLDSHTDTPLKFMNDDFDISIEHDARTGGGKIDIPRMEKGGLDAVFFAVFIGQGSRDSIGYVKAFNKADEIFDAIYNTLKPNSDKAKVAFTPEDGYDIEKEGKRSIYLGIENGYPIGLKLDNSGDGVKLWRIW